MKKIDTITDLKNERKRLNLLLKEHEANLENDLLWAKEELKPLNAAAKMISKILVNKNTGALNAGLGLGIDVVLKNIIFAKSGWLTKLIIPYIVKNFSSNMMEEKKPEIFSFIKGLISKLRNKNHKHNGVYDASTAGGEY